jgi:hypothetical protein
MRDDFILTEPVDQRLEFAIDLFDSQRAIVFNGVVFRRSSNGHVQCESISQWDLASLTDSVARNEIQRAKDTFDHLCTSSKRFSALVDKSEIRYSLIEDYGTGSVEICREAGEQLVWTPGIKRV